MSNIQPSPGRIVIYHLTRGLSFPAIIIGEYGDNTVDLTVFRSGGVVEGVEGVAPTFPGDPNVVGRYSWPKRVGPGV